ncbi:MAG TPA: hotdog fold thioesterase [Steroidobacteraceae bacterium]|nr:hotdog fold thioesterase [Steroidobacteraceae bacterium]
MSIWFAPFTLEDVNRRRVAGLAAELGMRFTAFGDDWLAATMPVDERTHQPMRLLHGGASLALAEAVGSTAGNLCIDRARFRCIGQEINGNHLRAATQGPVTATARPQHVGARSQVWQIEIRDPAERLVCASRLTLAVVPAA